MHMQKFPDTASQIKLKSYVDDIGVTGENIEALQRTTTEADIILKHANMEAKKCSTFV